MKFINSLSFKKFGTTKPTIHFLGMAIVFMFAAQHVYGQSTEKITFSYDDSGNQTSRVIYMPSKSSKADSTGTSSSMLKSSTGGTGTTEVASTQTPKYEDVISEKKITIYPNPTKGQLRIDIGGSEIPKDARIQLYNVQGSLVRQLTGISDTNELDISAQPAGTYIMRIMLDKNNISTWKIIKN